MRIASTINFFSGKQLGDQIVGAWGGFCAFSLKNVVLKFCRSLRTEMVIGTNDERMMRKVVGNNDAFWSNKLCTEGFHKKYTSICMFLVLTENAQKVFIW